MSNIVTKNIIDKIYEKYKKKVDYKEFNDSFSKYVDSVNIEWNNLGFMLILS